MFITKGHYNTLVGYRDVAEKALRVAKDVNANNKQICDFNERLIKELRNERIEVAMEILAELKTRATWFCENQTAYEHFVEELAELKKKYTEGVT